MARTRLHLHLQLLLFCLLLFLAVLTDGSTVRRANHSILPESYGMGIRDDMVDWSRHPCRRPCRSGRRPLSCRYGLTVELYSTMSKACYDCPYNSKDCFRKHCIVADGTPKVVIVANRQLPGTTIEACEGDQILVDVTNALQTDTTSIHWHGLHMRKTPYMDGVPYITQCPILPGETFRYEFEADQAGTFVWHSHSGEQRADGLFGALVIRPTLSLAPSKNHHTLYDLDEHVITINEWTEAAGIYSYVLEYQNGYPQAPHTILVNGLGPWESSNSKLKNVPVPVFNVKKGKRYRFRLINVGAQNCPIMVSVENHKMLAISVDGADIKPVEVDAIRSLSGERYDFVIETNASVGNYRIHFDGESSCVKWRCHQIAVLRYEGAPIEAPIDDFITRKNLPKNKDDKLRILNPFNQGTETPTALTIPTLNCLSTDDHSYDGLPDHQFFISYDFFELDNDNYHRKNLYGYHQVKSDMRMPTLQLNHVTFKMPNFPILTQPELITPDSFCNYTTTKQNCTKEYCSCTQVLQADLGSLVEIVLLDEGKGLTNHPMHLHGYHFRVVAMEKVDKTFNVARFKSLDKAGKIHRKLKAAPLKDTVLVPTGGYTILRLRANNPGYWFFHCHIDSHATVGMALVLKVGQHKDFPIIPNKFPKCYGSRRT